MKDYLGNELRVGDTVVFAQIGYRNLMKGVVVNLSNKKAKITHERTNTGKTHSIQFHNQMIVVSGIV